MSLFAPRLPAEEWAAERERIARKAPRLALVPHVPPPPKVATPDFYVWHEIKTLLPVEE